MCVCECTIDDCVCSDSLVHGVVLYHVLLCGLLKVRKGFTPVLHVTAIPGDRGEWGRGDKGRDTHILGQQGWLVAVCVCVLNRWHLAYTKLTLI